MYESLITYINAHANTTLTTSEVDLIKDIFTPQIVKKKKYFLNEGKVSKHVGFIVKGAMQQYSVDNKGIKHVVGLLIENWWVVDRESNMMLTPSIYSIEAVEDTELLVITTADFKDRLNTIPAITEMARKLDENYAVASQKRMNASISLSAEDRYSDLRNIYPEFLQRFPQHIIASYLGITKETLSRIRRRSVKK